MEIMAVPFILILDTLLVRTYYINTKSCRSCSNREEVPCLIQELDFHCLHDEFSGIWPGLPRNLRSRRVSVGSDELAANFTWNGPYDASYKTLNGFLLTLNIAQDYIGPDFHIARLQEPPRCFFANLSGTNWDLIVKPYSVVFHFDCVTARADDLVEVSLTLKSSPVPAEKSFKPLTSSLILRRDREPYVVTPNFTINLTVVGSIVKVKFGPLKQNMIYRVCLVAVAEEYHCYRDINTQEGQDTVVFTDVEANTYRVYVQRGDNPDNPMYTSKPFNVSVKPATPSQRPIAPSVVAIITVGCLLFVAGATTLCFCLMRDRCHWFPQNCVDCNCKYQPAPQSVQNNTNGEADDSVQEILPMFYDESENFTSAVEKICTYLNRWSNCKVNHNWITGFSGDQTVPFRDKHPNGVLLIVLSCKMWRLLNEVFYTTNYQRLTVDPKLKLFRKILIETNGKPYRRFIVSLHPLPETGKQMKGIEIFQMTKYALGQSRKKLEMNTEDLYSMLKMLSEEGVVSGWAAYEELAVLHTAIKYVPESDIFTDQRSDICDSRFGSNRMDHDQFMAPEMDQDIESVSVCQDGIDTRGTAQIPYHDFAVFEPKDDTESISWSAIGQKQYEMYEGYRASLQDSLV